MATTIDRLKRYDALVKVRDLITSAEKEGRKVSGVEELKLVIELLGSRCGLFDGPAWFRAWGISQGYDIPPYAYSGSGDIREILKDSGASTVRDWYDKKGVGPELYDHIDEIRLVVPISKGYKHRVYPLPSAWDSIDDEYARHLALHLIDFCLADDAIDAPLDIRAGDVVF